ncbi:MAG: ABC transporter permease subunit [Planctomycetota bacterium]
MDFLTVFRKETLNESRRLRQYMMRVAYVGIVFALIVLFNRERLFNLGKGAGRSAIEISYNLTILAQNLYNFTAFSQILAALLITPVLVTASFQSERRYGTLELLSITRLKDRDVVFGKVSARFLLMGLLLLAGLPVLATIKIFGFVTLQLVIGNFFCALSAMLVAGATAAYFGLTARSLLQAIGYTYAAVAGFLVVTFVAGETVMRIAFSESTFGGMGDPIRHGIGYCVNPVWAQFLLMDQALKESSAQYLLGMFWVITPIQVITALLVAWYWLMRAEQQYRWWRLGISSGSQAAEYQRTRQADARAATADHSAGGEAFDMHDRALARRGRIRMFERTVIISCLVVEGIMILASMNGDAGVHRVGLIVQFMLLGAAACVVGGASIAQEQEDHTMVVLLTTPLEPQEILWGKVRSLMRALWIPAAVMGGHALLYAIGQQIEFRSMVVVAATVPVYLALILVVSLIISSRIPRAGRAVTYALAVLLVITLGTYMGGVLIGAAGAGPDDPLTVTGETIRSLNPLVLLYDGVQPGSGMSSGRVRASAEPRLLPGATNPDWHYIGWSLLIATGLTLLFWRLLMARFNSWVRQNI